MKPFKLMFMVLAGTFIYLSAVSQNVVLNILTRNSGQVNMGGNLFLEVSVCNTDPTYSVPGYRIIPQISVPTAIVSIPGTGHILPPGWSIISNEDGVIILSNGIDVIAPNGCRTILILLRGKAPGGPSTISGQLSFSNGPGLAPGAPTAGDLPADNFSTTTCNVTM
ncbi:MAG: hypothetical protein ABIO55_05235 [Ginsengibacter sp.]